MLYSEAASGLTVATASKGVQLSTLKREYGMVATMQVTAVLREALAFMPHSLSATDMANYAARIMADRWDLKLEDIVLILKNGTSGLYGKIYGQFTYVTFMEWIEKYEQERLTYHEVEAKSRQESPEVYGRGSEIKSIEEGIERAKNTLAIDRFNSENK